MPKRIIRALHKSMSHVAKPKLIIILTCFVIAALAVTVHAWFSSAVATSQVQSPTQRQNRSAPNPAPYEVERVTITPTGFEPAQINRPASPFVLAIDNRSGLQEATLEVFREDGHKLHEIKGPKGQLNQRKFLDLPPGSYVLKVANHPDWSCQILLTH